MTDKYIEVHDLTAGYKGTEVLENISFDICRGEMISIVGPNGAGKSTLLYALSGLLAPMSGKILIEGQDLNRISDGDRARRIAVMFTERVKKEAESCLAVVSEGRYPYTGWFGRLSDADMDIVKKVMEMTDCLTLADRNFNELSDGQKQRVLLARAIAQEPGVLILDEPTTFLDLKYQLELLDLLKNLSRDAEHPLTIIMSLHELNLSKKFADRVLMLGDRGIVAYGKPDDVMTVPALTKLYGIEEQLLHDFMAGNIASEKQAKSTDADINSKAQLKAHMASNDTATENGLRRGFTTGTSAALASQGAAEYLLTGIKPSEMSVMTPAGISVSVTPFECGCDEEEKTAFCTVVKNAGDDPDVTNGIHIRAEVTLTDEEGIFIDGGEGIGRVTLPGLDQPVGEAAINHVPRKMISDVLKVSAEENGYTGGFKVIINAENGEAIAAKTLNSTLGIKGGISIIGTSGIVEPMSEKALVDTIRVAVRQAAAMGNRSIILTPGNYGADFIKKNRIDRLDIPVIQMSNFIGDALDIAANAGIERVMLIGHTGKLVKLAASVMNTHSKYADGRREIFACYAALAGASAGCIKKLYESVTSDACIDILKEESLLQDTEKLIIRSIQANLERRAGGKFEVGALLFSNVHGLFGITDKGKELLTEFGYKGAL